MATQVLSSWGAHYSWHTTSLVKSTQQGLQFLRRTNRANLRPHVFTTFFRRTRDSFLTSLISVCYGSCILSDQRSDQRVMRTAENIIRTSLLSIQDLHLSRYLCRATNNIREATCPAQAVELQNTRDLAKQNIRNWIVAIYSYSLCNNLTLLIIWSLFISAKFTFLVIFLSCPIF